MGLHPIVRPLGLFLAFLGIIQGITWGVLSMISVLQYSGVLEDCPGSASTYTDLIGGYICVLYMQKDDHKGRNDLVMSSTFYILSYICLEFCINWIIVSCLLIWGLTKNKWAIVKKMLIAWMAVVTLISIEDLITTIMLFVDISRFTTSFNLAMNSDMKPPPLVYVQIFSMHILTAIVAKGYVLWMVNVASVIYVLQFLRNGEVKESPMFDKESRPTFIREDRSTRISIDDNNLQTHQTEYINSGYCPDEEYTNRIDNLSWYGPEMIDDDRPYNAEWSKNSNPTLSSSSFSRNSTFARVGRASKNPILGQHVPPPRIPTPDYSISSIRIRPGNKY